jgi:hypothetical protein
MGRFLLVDARDSIQANDDSGQGIEQPNVPPAQSPTTRQNFQSNLEAVLVPLTVTLSKGSLA